MKLYKNKETKVLVWFCLVSVLIIALTFILPIDGAVIFSDFWAPIWVFITRTGGPVGVFIIIVMFSISTALQYKNIKRIIIKAGFTFVILSSVVSGTALFNEYFIKERVKVYRPSILYLEKNIKLNAAQFYGEKGRVARRMYLMDYFKSMKEGKVVVNERFVHEDILDEWMDSTGYSFPSGHTVSAFLLVTMLGYYFLKRYELKNIWLPSLLYAWAIVIAYSRVLIGIHSALDVTLGAFWGSLIGLLLLATGVFDRLWKPNPDEPLHTQSID